MTDGPTADQIDRSHPLGGPLEADWTCPRCGARCRQHFYGPCASCREALRAKFPHAARTVETEAWTPKMNVTPNAVALRDD